MIALKANSNQQKARNGVRALDLRRDISAVSKLLELVFHQHIGRAGRQALAPGYAAGWALIGQNAPVPGFVYVHEKRIIGNVSLLQSKEKGRYLVANVAVHPDFRRRGIARKLMQQVINYIRKRQGHSILLQVEENNQGAINLYYSLRFREVGTATIWQLSHYHLRPIAAPRPVDNKDQYSGFAIVPLRSSDWYAAYDLDRTTFPLDMQWPEPITKISYKTSWWKGLINFVNGQQQEIWSAKTDKNELVGLAVIDTSWGRPHTVRLRLHPQWSSRIARPILAKLLRRLRTFNRRPIIIDHLKDDAVVDPLLNEAGFQKRRTLTTMRLDLKPAPRDTL
ncbi:MAG: N-acetyltransferase [Ardenticatenaceae bacterium]|nr:N-acetyltransferase [Ardenticatenaceae bacterium]